MKKGSLLVLYFLVFHFVIVFGQEDMTKVKDVQKFQKELFSSIEKTNSIQSSFIQEKHLSFFDDVIISKGQFSFKKENKLCWEYISPFKYLIIFNQQKIFIKDEEKTNTFDTQSNKMFKQVNEMMTNVLRGKILENKDYDKEYYENDDFYYIKLYPTQTEVKKLLKEIHIHFSKKDFTVTKINMIEAGGDYTLISFSDIQLNKVISDEKFSLPK